jgi:hypothetical protein
MRQIPNPHKVAGRHPFMEEFRLVLFAVAFVAIDRF